MRAACASRSTGLKTRSELPGCIASIAAGRIGRGTRLPVQFGHTPCSTPSAQVTHQVHSYVQIRASALSGGRSTSQFSQDGRSSSITVSLTRPRCQWHDPA